jgi:hypothetical protein
MSRTLLLPSGKLATRFWSRGEFYWQLPTRGSDDWVTLGDADIRALAEFVADENRETGGSVPAAPPMHGQVSAPFAIAAGAEPPVLNKSGGSWRPLAPGDQIEIATNTDPVKWVLCSVLTAGEVGFRYEIGRGPLRGGMVYADEGRGWRRKR